MGCKEVYYCQVGAELDVHCYPCASVLFTEGHRHFNVREESW